MTEDEAKTTQCCGPEGCGYFNDEPRPARWCVGSGCMGWRWKHSPEWVASAAIEAPMRHAREPFVASGYCGLAGKET